MPTVGGTHRGIHQDSRGDKLKSDKLKHIGFSFIVALAVGLFTAWWWGEAVALALGVAKEVRDERWDWGDFAADLAGLVPAGGMVWLIEVLTK